MVTGLGRQSKLMLDNLGIMIDTGKVNDEYAESIGKTASQLTDQEKKIAFTNAAMESAQELVDMLGDEQLSTKDKAAQLTTAIDGLVLSLGEGLIPILLPLANNDPLPSFVS